MPIHVVKRVRRWWLCTHEVHRHAVDHHCFAPNLQPFASLDFFEVMTTLLDALVQLYSKLMDTTAFAAVPHVRTCTPLVLS